MTMGERMVGNYRRRFLARNTESVRYASATFRWCLFSGVPELAAEFLSELDAADHDAAVEKIEGWLETRPWVVTVYGFEMPDLSLDGD